MSKKKLGRKVERVVHVENFEALERIAAISESFQLLICDGTSFNERFPCPYPLAVLEITTTDVNGNERIKVYEAGGNDSLSALTNLLEKVKNRFKDAEIIYP